MDVTVSNGNTPPPPVIRPTPRATHNFIYTCKSKLYHICRCIVFSSALMFTIFALIHSIMLYGACRDTAIAKECALGHRRNLCTPTEYPAVILFLASFSLAVMVYNLLTKKTISKDWYQFFILVISIELIFILVIGVTEKRDELTKGSKEVIYGELSKCRSTNISKSRIIDHVSTCWHDFRLHYCPKWIYIEHRNCLPFTFECDSLALGRYGTAQECMEQYFYDYSTPSQVIDECVKQYSKWAISTYDHYYSKTIDLLIYTTVMHNILAIFMAISEWLFMKYSKAPNPPPPGYEAIQTITASSNPCTASPV